MRLIAREHSGVGDEPQAITLTKRDAQSRVVSLLLDKNEEKQARGLSDVTDVENSGGDLQVVDKVGVPDGI
jgi:hypothetical protein